MPSRIHHSPWGIFYFLISQTLLQCKFWSIGPKLRPVSLALPQSKPGSLGPKPTILPRALPCNPPKLVKGFLGLFKWNLRPPLAWILKSSSKTKAQNWNKNPNTMATKKGRARLKTMPLTSREPYTNMQSHACPNQLGNDTCKRLPTSISY